MFHSLYILALVPLMVATHVGAASQVVDSCVAPPKALFELLQLPAVRKLASKQGVGLCDGVAADALIQVSAKIPLSKYGASGYKSNFVKLPNGFRVRVAMNGEIDFFNKSGTRNRIKSGDGFLYYLLMCVRVILVY